MFSIKRLDNSQRAFRKIYNNMLNLKLTKFKNFILNK